MQSRKLAFLLFPVAAIVVADLVRGDILTQYSFTDIIAGQLNRDATTVAPNVTAGSIADAPIVNNRQTIVLTRAIDIGYATQPTLAAARDQWGEAMVPENVYFSFSVAANAGFELDLSSLNFNIARGGAATPRTYDVRTSLDSFATSLTGVVEVTTQRPTFTPVSIPLSAAQFQDLSSPLTFRIHIFAPTAFQNLDFDDITVNGTVVVAQGLLGDFNSDNKVDSADYVTWRKNETANLSLPNDNALTNQADRYTLWRANFGNPVSGSGIASLASVGPVPEPAAFLLASMALGIVSLIRRR